MIESKEKMNFSNRQLLMSYSHSTVRVITSESVMKKSAFFAILILLTVTACKEPFTPEVASHYKNILVVEGYLNIGGSTTFTISRTGDLKDFQARIPEPGARIEVQDSQGTVTQALTAENGQCSLATFNLDLKKNYRIKITTRNGNTYGTDYLESKLTPPIDSISRRVENRGFKLYVNTHDSSNNARFYSWDFLETWEIASQYLSFLEYTNGQIVPRDRNVNISRCWQNTTSSEILLGSTERQSEDKISSAPIAFVAGNSIKLGELYSILVRQYTHSRGGYQYLENMKKNTEKIGTIFDPQPSEIKGNITCISNPKEQVIGWIDAGSVTEKRVFINRTERLPDWAYRREPCDLVKIPLDSVVHYTLALYLITDYAHYDPAVEPPFAAMMTKARCIDCRLLGTNVKPSFWPN